MGRVACGSLKQGDPVVIMPKNLAGEATTIEIFHSDRKEVIAGDLVGNALPKILWADLTLPIKGLR